MKQSLHAKLSHLLREVQAACTESAATGVPVDEVVEIRAARRAKLPRRTVLLGGAAAATTLRPRFARADAEPRVVIIGAGLAGLACARALWLRHGIAASIYEWADHIGGRVTTLRGYFDNGVIAEQHGEFISSEHKRMRALAAGYGLTLDNVNLHEGQGTVQTGWFAGQRYTEAALAQDWQKYAWALFREAVRRAPGATYLHASPQARIWDNMSVTDWVERNVPGGSSGPFGALCLSDAIDEFGGPPELQSALNLIYVLGYDASDKSGYQPRDTPLLAGLRRKIPGEWRQRSDNLWHGRRLAGRRDQSGLPAPGIAPNRRRTLPLQFRNRWGHRGGRRRSCRADAAAHHAARRQVAQHFAHAGAA